VLLAALDQVDELVAELDEGVAGPLRTQAEIKDLAIKRQRPVDVADLDRDVIDAHQARFAALGSGVFGPADCAHRLLPSWSRHPWATILCLLSRGRCRSGGLIRRNGAGAGLSR
jgi:hypothetical protein